MSDPIRFRPASTPTINFRPLTPSTDTQESGDIPAPSEIMRYLPTKEQLPEFIGSMAGGIARKTLPGMALAAGGAALGEGVRQATMEEKPLTPMERAKLVGGAALRGAVGEGIARPIGKAVEWAFAPAAKGVTPEIVKQVESARALGVEPPLRTMTEAKPVQATERMAEFAPLGMGSFVTKANDQAVKQFEAAAEGIAGKVGPNISPEVMSEAIPGRIKVFEKVFRSTKDKLYDAADKLLPKGVKPELSKTTQALNEIIGRNSGAMEPAGLGKLKQILGEVLPQDQGVPGMLIEGKGPKIDSFQKLKSLRSRLGSMIGEGFNDPGLTGIRSELKKLYAAMSQDLDATAAQAGPGFQGAIQNADAIYSKGIKKLQNYLIPALQRASERDPNNLYKVVIRNDNPTLVKAGREILGEDTWNQVKRQWFESLLDASKISTEGAVTLSPGKLATNIRKLGDTAEAIFENDPALMAQFRQLEDTALMLTRGQKVAQGSQTAYIGVVGTLGNIAKAILGTLSAGAVKTNFGKEYLTRGFPRAGRIAGNVAERGAQIGSQLGLQKNTQ